MTVAFGQPSALLLEWVHRQLKPEHGFAEWDVSKTLVTILFDEAGKPVACTVIDGMNEHSCDVTFVSDGTKRWGNPKFICATYEYMFDVLKRNRLNMIVAANNEPALAMNKAFGHVQEGVHRDYFGPGRDAISFSYLRSDWLSSRWYARSNRSRSVNTPNSRGATHGQEIRGRGPDSGVHDGVDGPGPKQSADGPGGHAS